MRRVMRLVKGKYVPESEAERKERQAVARKKAIENAKAAGSPTAGQRPQSPATDAGEADSDVVVLPQDIGVLPEAVKAFPLRQLLHPPSPRTLAAGRTAVRAATGAGLSGGPGSSLRGAPTESGDLDEARKGLSSGSKIRALARQAVAQSRDDDGAHLQSPMGMGGGIGGIAQQAISKFKKQTVDPARVEELATKELVKLREERHKARKEKKRLKKAMKQDRRRAKRAAKKSEDAKRADAAVAEKSADQGVTDSQWQREQEGNKERNLERKLERARQNRRNEELKLMEEEETDVRGHGVGCVSVLNRACVYGHVQLSNCYVVSLSSYTAAW